MAPLCEALESRQLLSVAFASTGSGTATTGSISGVLYNDSNNDNKQDNGEVGLAGWTVFIDANKNGRLDSGELSTTTNGSGQYSFTGLSLGTYNVAEVLPSAYVQTVPGATGLSPGVDSSVKLTLSRPNAAGADLPVPVANATTNYFVTGEAKIPGKSAGKSASSGAAAESAAPLDSPALLAEQDLSPQLYTTAYGLNGLTFGSTPANGAGQTIAIIDAYNDPDIASDLAEFDSYFGVAAPPSFAVVSQTGSTTSLPTNSGSTGWSLEESLDVEWAHAVAPAANIILVEANSTSDADLFGAVDWARNDPGVSVVSMSFSGPESSGIYAADDYHFTTPPGHTGVTFLAATGDYGKYAGQNSKTVRVGYPAASSFVVAVGGTTLLLADSNGDYGSESAWGNGTSTNTEGGSGGGISKYNIQPPYQTGVVTQSTTDRTIPDIALDADPNTGAEVIDSYDYPGYLVGVGGTSFATPSMAGMIAIANQGRVLAGEAPLDGPTQTLPAIYQLPSSDFHDITTGNNGYAAGVGYDLDTGVGSPIGNLFIPALVNFNTQQAVNEISVTLTSGTPNVSGESFPDQAIGAAPTVATAPTATATNSTGDTYALSVLGASAKGESTLTYTWSAGANSPGTVQFSANGTNASKNSIATFSVAGTYTLNVTITDATGLSVTASVVVNASASFNAATGSTLTITGTNAADTIALTTNNNTLTVTLNGVSSLPESLASIAAIQINGLNGNDTISLDGGVPNTTIVGASGIDTINTISAAVVTFVDSNAAGALIKQGSGTLTLSAANSFSGSTISAGTLLVSAAGALPPGSSVVDNASLIIDAGSVIDSLSGSGSISIADNSVLQLAPAAATSSIASLSIAAGSALDITNNALLVSQANDSLATIALLVNGGSNGGLWNGSGIISSDVVPNSPGGANYANDNNGQKTVGYASSSPPQNNVPAGLIEIKYTLAGDFNLDGTVDIADYLILQSNYLQTGVTFQQGDVNGDGVVNISDYLALQANFLQALNPATGL